MAARQVRFTATQLDSLAASARILAAAGKPGGAVVADVWRRYAESPAPDTARPARAVAAASPAAEPTPDQVYAAMNWPEAPPPRQPPEPDWLGLHDQRRAYLTSQAAGGTAQLPGMAPPPPGYGDLSGGPDAGELVHEPVTAVHEHEHSDYRGGTHAHVHAHAGDGSHEPGENHQHKLAAAMADPAVAAGISRRAAEQVAAAARRKRVEDMTDGELRDSLPPPPGWW